MTKTFSRLPFACFAALLALSVLATPVFAAGPAAKISQLTWMTGSYEGPAGPNTLEENWSEAKDGSIASLVRMTGNDATSMVELIVIEEEEGSLVLRLQQWDPGFKPRTDEPQTMDLVEVTENKVTFKARGEGGIQVLTYSKPAPDKFTISIESGGGAFDIPLSKVTR